MSLHHRFNLAVQQGQYVRRIPAIMGLTSGTLTAPGSLGYKYVRLWLGMAQATALALDPYGFSPSADDPIWIDVERDGRMVISGPRYIGS